MSFLNGTEWDTMFDTERGFADSYTYSVGGSVPLILDNYEDLSDLSYDIENFIVRAHVRDVDVPTIAHGQTFTALADNPFIDEGTVFSVIRIGPNRRGTRILEMRIL